MLNTESQPDTKTLPTLMGGGIRNNKSRMAGSSTMFATDHHQSSPTRSKTPTSTKTNMPSTSDILFLKRLLFLKAAIDNE